MDLLLLISCCQNTRERESKECVCLGVWSLLFMISRARMTSAAPPPQAMSWHILQAASAARDKQLQRERERERVHAYVCGCARAFHKHTNTRSLCFSICLAHLLSSLQDHLFNLFLCGHGGLSLCVLCCVHSSYLSLNRRCLCKQEPASVQKSQGE